LVETLLGTLTQTKDAAKFQTSWATLAQHFDELFTTEDSIAQLKQAVLQLAVMGKLVPQDPTDEPAGRLLQRIKKEKQKLIEAGKIKKEKMLLQILDSELPFELPHGWQFARLGEITNKIGSGSTPRGGKESYSNEGVLFIRSQNVWNHGLELDDVALITNETHERMAGTKVYPNDILLNITGGSLGRSTIIPEDAEEANVSQHVTIIRPANRDTRFFLHLCIISPYGQQLIWGRQVGANREGLSKKVLELFEIPIPPLNEQQRIVHKVNELFSLCDKLAERLGTAQVIKNQLADSVSI
jgi:type I restriction enzyme S subunit